MNRILVCCDLDRTVLPNGKQPASENSLSIFAALVSSPKIKLAYVTGRNKSLIKKAIEKYGVPLPDYAIGDVGTSLYEPPKNWRCWHDWTEEIGRDWNGKNREDLGELLTPIEAIWPQEEEKQNSHKLSYYTESKIDVTALKKTITDLLESEGVMASIIWSVDEEKDCGLLDILPKRATKSHGIRYLMKKKGFSSEQTVFAGDSGNDLPALTSGLNAILVKNASDDVRKEAVEIMRKKHLERSLYLAKGGFLGMNGNYSAGVLEGIHHFLPDCLDHVTL